jgi:hypothetical protein
MFMRQRKKLVAAWPSARLTRKIFVSGRYALALARRFVVS